MLLTEFLTLGIMTLTTAGGALGGYLYRGRKANGNLIENARVSEAVLKQPVEGNDSAKKETENNKTKFLPRP